jgi:hypothetical protein
MRHRRFVRSLGALLFVMAQAHLFEEIAQADCNVLRRLIEAVMSPGLTARPTIDKTTSLDYRLQRRIAKAENTASGKALIVKPALQAAMTLGQPLESLLRRVPPSGGRGRPRSHRWSRC